MLEYFSWKDGIDVLLVALLIYYIYKLMKRSSAANVFSGIILFLMVWIVFSQIFALKVLGTMLDYVVNIGALALVILFQEEIRRFLSTIGKGGRDNFIWRLLKISKNSNITHSQVMPIVLACMNMSRQKIGALIVVERSVGLGEFIQSGDVIDANINQRLIENIFFKNSPLHDGATIIRNGRIVAASCIMPVSHDEEIPKYMGLRHRAAMGISQKTDAIAIVVSEETGNITVAKEGSFFSNLTADQLEQLIQQ